MLLTGVFALEIVYISWTSVNGLFIAAGGRDDLGDVLWTSENGSNWKAILRVKDHIAEINYEHSKFYLAPGVMTIVIKRVLL
jgi:hypothetical protein